MSTGHRQIDHTADLALQFWAPTEEELLIEAARTIVGELTDGADINATSTRQVELQAIDPGDRLVQWLNEILVLAITDGFLTGDAKIMLAVGETAALTATLRGEANAGDRIRSELKSVTDHELVLGRREDGGWSAQVVIDV